MTAGVLCSLFWRPRKWQRCSLTKGSPLVTEEGVGSGSLVTGDLGHQLGQHAIQGSTGCQASLVATRWGWACGQTALRGWTAVSAQDRSRPVHTHTHGPFSGSYFLVSSLAGIDVWAALSALAGSPEASAPGCPSLPSPSGFGGLAQLGGIWEHKREDGAIQERAPQASPLESLSACLFSACRHFHLGSGHGPHPGFLGSMGWSSAFLGIELAAKQAGEGRVELGGEAGSARPPCWVTSTEFSQLPPQAPDACGLPPCLGSCTEKYEGSAALWLGAWDKGPGPLGLLCH
jgi:hypothetical protein